MKKIKQPVVNNQNVLKDQLARAMADYSNLQKRTDEERGTMFKLASISFMTKILPIIDNLKQAQNHINDSGIAIIIGQLETLAKEEGFDEIKINVGDEFSELTSEVTEVLETLEEKDNNKVAEVIVSGWRYSDGTVVRHARVKVFKFMKKNNDEKWFVENEVNKYLLEKVDVDSVGDYIRELYRVTQNDKKVHYKGIRLARTYISIQEDNGVSMDKILEDAREKIENMLLMDDVKNVELFLTSMGSELIELDDDGGYKEVNK